MGVTSNCMRAQREASKYVESVCDLCCRARPDAEDEDYKPASVKKQPEIFCEGYRYRVDRARMTGCELFAPDLWRIRSVMAHMAIENAQGMAALDALLNG